MRLHFSFISVATLFGCSIGCSSKNRTDCVPVGANNATLCSPGTPPCNSGNNTTQCCPVIVEPECKDQVKFCANLKKLCMSRSHRKVLARECALTCVHCKPTQNITLPFLGRSQADAVNSTVLHHDRVMRSQPSEANHNVSCSGTSCSEPPTESEVYTANMTVVIGAGHRVRSVDLKMSEGKKTPVIVSDPNETLKSFALKKKEELELQVEATQEDSNMIEQIQLKPEKFDKIPKLKKNATLEMRKVKLEELMSSTDLKLPRVTRAPVETISISLAKTLIRGTCFDEYLYCREFASLCTHPTFGDVMSLHCTMTCKRCDDVDTENDYDENCSDASEDCLQYVDVCHNERYLSLTKQYCSKTCGHCQPKCRDRHQNCSEFARDGFCSDEMYTLDERTHLCGNTCKFCKA